MSSASLLVFHRGGHRFAVPLEQVRRVVPSRSCQPVPLPAPGVEGMINSAGEVHTLLTTLLPAPLMLGGRPLRWLLVRGSAAFGFQVDQVDGVRDVSDQTEPDDDSGEDEGAMDGPWEPAILGPVRTEEGTAWVLDVEALLRLEGADP